MPLKVRGALSFSLKPRSMLLIHAQRVRLKHASQKPSAVMCSGTFGTEDGRFADQPGAGMTIERVTLDAHIDLENDLEWLKQLQRPSEPVPIESTILQWHDNPIFQVLHFATQVAICTAINMKFMRILAYWRFHGAIPDTVESRRDFIGPTHTMIVTMGVGGSNGRG